MFNCAIERLRIVVGVLALATLLNGPSLAGDEPPKHALLIGCTDYPNLDAFFQLEGPANDVQLFQRLLIERFEFDASQDDIVILAATEDESHQPTRANIEREFRRLGESVGKDEPVVILLAGHGSQQPDDDPNDPNDSEPDGLDEMFLPSDVGTWDGKQGSVANAITDDMFRKWLSAIVDREAFVWLIMDSCHSGSGVRGSDEEVSRQVPPNQLVPVAVLDAASLMPLSSAAPVAEHRDSLFDGPGGMVALYAAQPHETTPEKKLPLTAGSARKYYGLLTYTISEILNQTSRSITYNELVEAVQTRYIMMGRRAPTPLIEGSHRDNLVLRQASLPERARILLNLETRDTAKINAGALRGITPGSILAVYPPVGDTDGAPEEMVGFIEVTDVSLTSAEVKSCDFEQHQAVPLSDFKSRSRCELVYRDIGDQQLRVAVDPVSSDGQKLSTEIRRQLKSALEAEESELIRFVDSVEDADWLLRYADRTLLLIPAEGLTDAASIEKQTIFAPRSLLGDWAANVLDDLEQIARAENLLQIAEATTETSRGGGGLGMEMNLLRQTSDGETERLSWQSGGRTLRDGDRVTVQLRNGGRADIDVTLLYVDSSYGITCLFPAPGELNRIRPREELVVPLRINAETTGLENLLTIAVKGENQPVDFSVLEQPSLERAVRMRGGRLTELETPLGRLCRTFLYGAGATRGVERGAAREYEIQLLPWTVKP